MHCSAPSKKHLKQKKMHSTSCNFFPAKLPLPAKTLHPAQKLLPHTKIRQVVSITTTPETEPIKSTPVPPSPAIDESVAALWDYQFLFVSQRSESIEPIILRTIDGSIPLDFPSGTYYLIGPGIFSDDHGSTVHPLDGHGYLRAFNINGSSGEVKYSARYVKTEAQREECDQETGCWKFTHRGPFSVLRGGRKIGNTKVMKNVANTSVVRWGKRLLCLWEGGDPYEIESEMLDTVGKFEMINGHDFLPVNINGGDGDVGEGGGGQKMTSDGGSIWDVATRLLKPILHGVFNMPPKRLLSHYKIDPHRDRLITVSCNAEDMLLPRSTFTFYEFDSNFKLLQKQDFNIPDQLMIHDWAFTDTYYILFGNRIKLDVAGSMSAVCGLSPMISALCVNPSKSTSPIYLLPRFTDKTRDWKVPIEAPSQMWLLHIGNAFENRDQNGNLDIQIHAAACSYQWFNFQKMFGYNWKNGKLDPGFMNARDGEENLLPHLVKVSIELEADGNCEKCSVEPLNQWTRPSDFPVINPTYSGSKNTYIYSATTSSSRQVLPHFPFDTVAKLNLVNESVSTWSVGSRRFIGEPVFVSKGVAEDDGYLLVIEYAVSIQRCYLLILDPKRIGEGTDDALVARIEVPKHLNFPLGFHGFWAAADD